MFVTGQKRRPLRLCCCEDDGIGCGQLLQAARLGGCEGDFCVERQNLANLRKGDHLIGFVLAHLAGQPFRQLQLDHGRNQPVRLFRQMLNQCLTSR